MTAGYPKPPAEGRATGQARTPESSTATKQQIVFCVRTDPDPHEFITLFERHRSIVEADSNRPQLSDWLELQ